MALTTPKDDIIEISTSYSVNEIGKKLQQLCMELKAQAEHIQSSSGALSAFDDKADIEVVLSGKAGMLSPQFWIVQIYVFDYDDHREIILAAIGSSGFSKVMYGTRGAAKMSASISKRDYIANVLKN